MRHSLRIRRGQSQDASLLAVLAAQVWLHTYATEGITGDIANYALSEFTPSRFLSLMNEPACRLFVAEDGQSLVGLAVVKFGVSCPASNSSTTELHTLYVQEHFVGRGVGKSLLQAIEAEAREQSNAPLWLMVNAKNSRAIAFYRHQGYSKIGTAYFVLGEGRYENHVLIGPDA
jgi:ribosomal protein S18 acetylase RimI-like enzyme